MKFGHRRTQKSFAETLGNPHMWALEADSQSFSETFLGAPMTKFHIRSVIFIILCARLFRTRWPVVDCSGSVGSETVYLETGLSRSFTHVIKPAIQTFVSRAEEWLLLYK